MARVRRNRRSPARNATALVVALAVHAVGLWAGWELARREASEAMPWRGGLSPLAGRGAGGSAAEVPIEIRSLDESEARDEKTADKLVEELSRLDDKAEEERRREEKKREEDEKAAGQVVQIARPAIEERPDGARFAAEYDSSVRRETRGPLGKRDGARVEVQGGEESRSGAERSERAERAERRGGLPGPRVMRRAGERGAEPRPGVVHGDNGQGGGATVMGPDGDSRRPGLPGVTSPAGDPHPARGRHGGSGGRDSADRLGMGEDGHGGPRLAPSDEMLNRAIARGTGSSDYLKDVDDGESTALNAKRFRFATFFNRVHDAVDHNWFAAELYVRRDPTGNVYGTKDRMTVVRVHLKPDGALQTVTLLESSGVSFLDDEAMDAIRRAAPFVNPPPQLVGADGLIHFNFGFFVDLNNRPQVKVFRYK